jgi:hypothetical protein
MTRPVLHAPELRRTDDPPFARTTTGLPIGDAYQNALPVYSDPIDGPYRASRGGDRAVAIVCLVACLFVGWLLLFA